MAKHVKFKGFYKLGLNGGGGRALIAVGKCLCYLWLNSHFMLMFLTTTWSINKIFLWWEGGFVVYGLMPLGTGFPSLAAHKKQGLLRQDAAFTHTHLLTTFSWLCCIFTIFLSMVKYSGSKPSQMSLLLEIQNVVSVSI